MHDKEKLYELIDEYWADYVNNRDLKDLNSKPIVINPSIPIIWFGDLEAYMNSNVKVITVGLNPSDDEFPNDDKGRFYRFPAAKEFGEKVASTSKLSNIELTGEEKEMLIKSYNRYFTKEIEKEPYEEWFGRNYGALLNIFSDYDDWGSFYYHDSKNTVIHIDSQSALATDPTWSNLALAEEAWKSIRREDLCKKLLDYLNPDIILFSQGQKYLEPLKEGGIECIRETIKTIPYKNGQKKKIERISYNVNGKLLIYGTHFKDPFGGVSLDDENHRNSIFKILDDYKTWKKRE